jgi:SAM-dependent methyltransferase
MATWKLDRTDRARRQRQMTEPGVPHHSARLPRSTRSTALATPNRRSAGAWHRSAALSRCGSWTGILAGELARLGADVVAVEPDPEMLAELRRRLPDVRALEGSAEALSLPDQSVDAVLCGQAMHWFDLDRALPEIGRVLRPGGVLAGLWNVEDDRVGWIAGLAGITKNRTTLSLWREAPQEGSEQYVLHTGSDWFTPMEGGEFDNEQVRTADELVASIATTSRFLLMEEAERARTLAAIHDFLDSQPETSTGAFTLPLVTAVLRAVRRP